MKRIWTAAFRAMDDVKETVRNSGDRLCSAITSLTLRLCDISLTETSDARQAMDVVLPLLLMEGIMSKVDNIRKASITMVMKLAKVEILPDIRTAIKLFAAVDDIEQLKFPIPKTKVLLFQRFLEVL